MKQIDLHVHTEYSDDAEVSVEKIIEKAEKIGLKALAITDHNTVGGVKEALKLSQTINLEIIPGIEFDTKYKGVILHILGYYLDWQAPEIDQFLSGLKEAKMDQFYERVKKLEELNFKITPEEVLEKVEEERPSGGRIVEVLFSKEENRADERLKPYLEGEKQDQPLFNFNLDYFRPGGKAYVPCWYPDSKEAIKLIRELGGVAVLAHPGATLDEDSKEIIKELRAVGLQGLEVYSTYHNLQGEEYFKKIANEYGLLMTAGSDFHGKLKPKIELGDVSNNNYSIIEELKRLAKGDLK